MSFQYSNPSPNSDCIPILDSNPIINCIINPLPKSSSNSTFNSNHFVDFLAHPNLDLIKYC